VESDFNRRLLFSGAINSGMSGGPAVNANGEVYGINVAKNRSGELVSYVVSAEFARALLARFTALPPSARQTPDFLPVMTEQLKQHQDRLQQALFAKPLFTRMLGRYQVPAEVPPLLKCWANTTKNDNKLRYVEDQVQCRVDAGIFIDERLYTGTVQMQHLLVSSDELNRLQFQSLINQRYRPAQLGMIRQHLTADRCVEEFIEHNGLQWRATVCAQAMKKFPGLYDFGVSAISLDANNLTDKGMRQALFTAMHLDGVTWDSGMQSVKRYLDALGAAKGVAK
jgi:serine protease Do